MISKENIIEKVKEILETKTSLKKDSNGSYTGEIYVDYRDIHVEDEKTLASLCEKSLDEIYDYISECSCDADAEEYNCISSIVEQYLSKEELDEYGYIVDDFIRDNVYFELPSDFIWSTPVLTNILITAYEDWNVEYTENTIYRDSDDDTLKIGNGGVKWLIEQQGYSVEKFEEELNIEEKPFSNEFYKTVYDELLNTTTSLNALVVSTRMTLREFINLKQSLADKTLKAFKIDKSCDIGLVDFWQGSGSMLAITLEKDLEIPLENISDIYCDSSFCYGIGNIYGHDSYSYWTEVKYNIVTA